MSASAKHVVVDGSNIATEGRTIPSLDQLESAVAEIRKDLSETEVTVVVDATFAHRIDPTELSRFETSALRGEYVSPPAGAIGRGDAFLLRIAEKVNATVLSNDSFQEFHGEHPWLFEPGRLLGATPVPGVGWIFVPRTPVRGPKSRVAVREASKAKTRVVQAVAVATAEATGDEQAAKGGSRRNSTRSGEERAREMTETPPAPARRPEAVNAPMPFITFIAEHPLGASVDGLVDSFTSHGAVIIVRDVRCYVPLSGLASPAPRSAREVLTKGARQEFLVTALDPARRGIELALPGVGIVRGVPSDETVAAEVAMTRPSRRRKAGAEAEGVVPAAPAAAKQSDESAKVNARAKRGASSPVPAKATSRTATAKVRVPAAKKSAPPKKAAATSTSPSRRAAPAKQTPAKQGAPKKAALTKVPAKKVAPQRVVAKRAAPQKTAPKKAATPAKRSAQQSSTSAPAKKTVAKKAAAQKRTAPAVTAPAPRSAPSPRRGDSATDLEDGPRRSGRSRR